MYKTGSYFLAFDLLIRIEGLLMTSLSAALEFLSLPNACPLSVVA